MPQVLIEDSIVTQPFWSPDSRFIAFFRGWEAEEERTSPAAPLRSSATRRSPIGGGTWNSDGVILFSGAGVIHRVLAAGGQPTPITELDESRRRPSIWRRISCPTAAIICSWRYRRPESAIYVGSIDSKERTRLFAAESRPLYAAPGYLLFNRGGTVFAQPFDADTLELSGEPVRVADGVPTWVQGAERRAPA